MTLLYNGLIVDVSDCWAEEKEIRDLSGKIVYRQITLHMEVSNDPPR